MKRAVATCLLLVAGAALLYGVIMTRRERAFRALVEQGDAALARDDGFGAIEAFTLAIALKSDSMAAHLKRGEAYRRRSEFDAALRDLRVAADLDRNAPLPRELLGDVQYGMGLVDGQFASARFTRALDYYRQSAALDDASARVQYKLGLAYYRAGQAQHAITSFRSAIRLDRRFAEGHYMLGVSLRAAGQPVEGIRSVERAVALAPAFLPAREELADAYRQLGRTEERLAHLEALLALQPGPARDRALALGYAQAGHLDRAIAQLGHASRKYPEDAETYVALGRLWLERTGSGSRVEIAKALEALRGAVGSDSSSEALTLLGRAQLIAGTIAAAEKTLQQAAGRFPVDANAFLLLAEIAERRGRTEAAQRALLDYASLVRTDALAPGLLVRIAEANLQAGNVPEARRLLSRALDKEPASPPALALQRRITN